MSASHSVDERTSRPSSSNPVEQLPLWPQNSFVADRRPSLTQSTAVASSNDLGSRSPLSRPNLHRRGITSIALPNVAHLVDAFNQTGRPRSAGSPKAGESPLHSALTGSYFALQPGSSGLEARSPAPKRPPASRSSHGIETFSGPPPALSTRRTYSTERAWRRPPATDPPAVHSRLTPRALANLDAANNAIEAATNYFARDPKSPSNDPSESSPTNTRTQSMPSAAGDRMTPTARKTQTNRKIAREDEEDSTLCGESSRESNRLPTDDSHGNEAGCSHSSQEDLFLKLASADATPDRKSGDIRSGEHQGKNSGSSRSRDRRYPASAHSLDQRHLPRVSSKASRASNTGSRAPPLNREISPDSPQFQSRRPSISESTIGIPSRIYRQSNLSHLTNDYFNPSPLASRSTFKGERVAEAVTPRVEGTESTVSTTAPSTVWDELDDLKSRIKKLELTSTMPSSSEAAISKATGERPRTATTTITTMSRSPKHDAAANSASPETSVLGGPDENETHPLLNAALAKSKRKISPSLYRTLEATVSDAIEMTRITGGMGTKESVPNTIDWQLKRKAENMCRNLTELCHVLMEDEAEPIALKSTPRPVSRDTTCWQQSRADSVEDTRYQQATDLELESTSTSRVISRLEARRSSLLGLGSDISGSIGDRDRREELAAPTKTTPSATVLNRTSTVLQRIHRNTDDDGETIARLSPRVIAEHGHPTSAERQLTSREYIAQHPVHGLKQGPSSVQSSLPDPESYFSEASPFPTTPIIQPGNRRHLDQSTLPFADSAHSVEAHQQRPVSLGQYALSGWQWSNSLSRRLRHSSMDIVGQNVENRES
ncbi:MAG: hypothetical protein Q9187_006136 [Circinaria calcarea]